MKDMHKAWVVAVDMGYGHQRAADPLLPWAEGGEIITANNYPGIPESDRHAWNRSEKFYNFISRMKSRGALGRWAFRIFDYFQHIDEYYLLRHDTKPTMQLKNICAQIARGWGQHLIQQLSEKPLPLITPFFTIAFMAEHWQYPGPIYAIVTDADISRAWAPLRPELTRIIYFASTPRSASRLEKYGVPAKNIITTGFPLPPELVGPRSVIAKQNLGARLRRLDTQDYYQKRFDGLIAEYLGPPHHTPRHAVAPSEGGSRHADTNGDPISIVFAVGGAGAQAEIGVQVLQSLAPGIAQGQFALHLVAGVSPDAARFFQSAVRDTRLEHRLGTTLSILFATSKADYFRQFNELLVRADILWTKPSELSFYAALGLPIIIAPPIGAQEIQNRKWLLYLGSGVDQLQPSVTHEWLPDLLASGHLAEAAMEGFVKMERRGLEHIIRTVFPEKYRSQISNF
ncbi:MAG: hypothetical protein HY978_00705 [Candidatus Liptonbacteria bacterium]|nr:hypothetical protein [Candidatus Liptonbacteria bacterium]